MLAAAWSAREAAEGHEAVCVSHQLPIWTLRRLVEGKPLSHIPTHRQCGLASLTSITFAGEKVLRVTYTEPAGPEPPDTTPGA
jgi:broad specificity phosphatase PhoE